MDGEGVGGFKSFSKITPNYRNVVLKYGSG